MTRYPELPGWKGTTTSKDAAEFVAPSAGRMMDRVEDYLRRFGPASPEEIAQGMARPGERLLLTSVRARVCQLNRLGRVRDTGERGLGESGRVKVIRWRLSSPAEYAAFLAEQAANDVEASA